MPVTLVQVARKARVSVATVSAVVNNKPEKYKITEGTINRVKKVVEELNYRPSPNARALHRGKTGSVGVLMYEKQVVGSEMYALWTEAFTTRFHERDINTMLLISDTNSSGIPKMVRERHVDGVVLIDFVPDEVFAELQKLKIPFVIANAYPKRQFDTVLPDDAQGMQDAVEHLVKLGHTKILYMGLKRKKYMHPSNDARFDSYFQTMHKYELSVPEIVKTPPDDTYDEACKWLKEALQQNEGDRPTAIITYWERWWSVIAKTCFEMNIRIPNDMSFITFNDTSLASCSFPRLTAVNINVTEMGNLAADMLWRKSYDEVEKLPSITVREQLVIRESTAVPGK